MSEAVKEEQYEEIKIVRPKRVKLTAEESLKRMRAFNERKDEIIAAVRKVKNRTIPT
jgi:hypothetical protein